ncbi:MAG: neuraminidase-like domain-containing protein, partial [Planctomycetota bacterium]
MDTDAAAALLLSQGLLPAVADDQKPAVFDFMPAPASNPSQAVATDAQKEQAIARLTKVSYLVRKLGLGRKELRWLASTETPSPSWLDFGDLPVVRQTAGQLSAAHDLYSALMELAELMRLRPVFERAEGHMTDLLEMAVGTPATESDFYDAFYEATGFARSDIATLGAQIVAPSFSSDAANFLKPSLLVRLHEALECTRRLGVPASEATTWLDPNEPNPQPTAEAVTRAARARYDEGAWLDKIAPPLRDQLRFAQRDALVAHIISHSRANAQTPSLDSIEDIYAHLLIDPEMNPCRMTSRVKHATSALQLFINRVLLGLESDECDFGSGREDAEREWHWLRSYRIWEANRKVFLFPENYLEPEWRMDKSPLFEELESKLLKGNLDNARAVDAYRDYLTELEQLSRLDVHAIAVEQVDDSSLGGPSRNLHVFAWQNRGDTGPWYHRIQRNMQRWTPWQPMDHEFSRSIVPMYIDGRLRLVSGSFELVPEKDDDLTLGLPTVPQTLGGAYYWPQLTVLDWTNDRWEHRSTQQFAPVFLLDTLYGRDPAERRGMYAYPDQRMITLTGRSYLFDRSEATLLESQDAFLMSPCGASFRRPEGMVFGKDSSAISLNGAAMLNRMKHDAWPTSPSDSRGGKLNFGRLQLPTLGSTLSLHIVDPTGAMVPIFGEVEQGAIAVADRSFAGFDEASMREQEHPVHDMVYQDSWISAVGGWVPRRSALPTRRSIKDGDATSPGQRSASSAMTPSEDTAGYLGPIDGPTGVLRFRLLSHPLVCDVRAAVEARGTDFFTQGTAQLEMQSTVVEQFDTRYQPYDVVALPYPEARFDFGPFDPNGAYNWELFFHIPFLLATRLQQEGRHEEAREWLHAVFNPSEAASATTEGVKRFWRFKPFYENDDLASIQTSLALATGEIETGTPKAVISQVMGKTVVQDPELGIGAQLQACEKVPSTPTSSRACGQ